MKKINLGKLVNRIALILLVFIVNLVNAQVGGGGSHGVVKPNVPIDMYEIGLVAVAVVMIVSYYFYTRSKKINAI